MRVCGTSPSLLPAEGLRAHLLLELLRRRPCVQEEASGVQVTGSTSPLQPCSTDAVTQRIIHGSKVGAAVRLASAHRLMHDWSETSGFTYNK